jgi:glycosyltransferase involved in cell wall biosynthesis
MSFMSIAKEAISAYKNKKYEAALQLFSKAGELYGLHLFSANIELCRRHLSGAKVPTMPSVAPTVPIATVAIAPQHAPGPNEAVSTPLATDFAIQSLSQYRGLKTLPHGSPVSDLPLVTFAMTSHNAVNTVENAVMSLINQSYPNVEVVVCDDRSTDGTWELLVQLASRMPKALRVLRLNCNSGTYLAKNAAISIARGSIIMFQDSDDYSHPDRVTVQIAPLLHNKDLIATRTKYCRFNPETGRIVPVANTLSKYGLITLAVRREAFDQIGFFDAVRKAGDDEWFQRMQHLYGKNRIGQLDVSLYLAELRSGSLVADMLTFNADGSVEQTSSKQRKDYVKQFKSRFDDAKKRRDWYKQNFPASPLRPVAKYPESITAIVAPTERVYASVCSIPKRVNQLECVVSRLLPQVDHLYVYLDKYEETPAFLLNVKKITVSHSRDFRQDHRDNAKFINFNDLKSKGSFYYFTCDDDLIYPFDYVRALVRDLVAYDNKVIVGLHGVVYEESMEKYFRRRFVYHFKDEMSQPRLVNNLGTGTVAFHSSIFDSLDPAKWKNGGMVDIFFANEALDKNVPLLCLARHSGWLTENEMPEDNSTLFGEFKDKERLIVDELKRGAPWGYKAILRILEKQQEDARKALTPALPLFADLVKVSEIFPRLR